jgi:hypothetical protein
MTLMIFRRLFMYTIIENKTRLQSMTHLPEDRVYEKPKPAELLNLFFSTWDGSEHTLDEHIYKFSSRNDCKISLCRSAIIDSLVLSTPNDGSIAYSTDRSKAVRVYEF